MPFPFALVACASARAVDSANGGPIIWRPIGRPAVVKPEGRESANRRRTENGAVLRILTMVGSAPRSDSLLPKRDFLP